MKECEINREDLCRKLKLDRSQFANKINNSRSKFNLYQVLRIAKELDESVEDLCSDKWEIIK